MGAIETIFYTTDFSRCSEQALPHALFFAREFGAELHLFHALIPHQERFDTAAIYPAEPEKVLRGLEEKAEEELVQLLADFVGDGKESPATVHCTVRRGPYAGPLILTQAEEKKADLIVLGTHGRRGLGRWVLGSVAEEVLRLADCPVLTVKEQAEPKPPARFRHILVPIDFSPCSLRALTLARQLAGRFGSRLTLLHVVEQVVLPSFYIPGAPGVFPHNVEALEGSAEKELRQLMETTPEGEPEVPFEVRVISAPAAQGIAETATEAGCDLIVLATHGLTGVERLILGSTAERVVRRSPCPVLTLGGRS